MVQDLEWGEWERTGSATIELWETDDVAEGDIAPTCKDPDDGEDMSTDPWEVAGAIGLCADGRQRHDDDDDLDDDFDDDELEEDDDLDDDPDDDDDDLDDDDEL